MDVVWTEGKCLGLGALAALGWLAITALDVLTLSQPPTLPPQPFVVRLSIRGALVLSLPAMVFILDRTARNWLRGHKGFTLAIILPAALLLALPSLIPPGTQQDEWIALMLVPTLSLGLAFGVSDAVLGLRRPAPFEAGYSPGVVAGIGFGIILLPAGVILLFVETWALRQSCTHLCYSLDITGGACSLGFGVGLAAVFTGSLGYAIGRRLPRLAKRAPAPNAR